VRFQRFLDVEHLAAQIARITSQFGQANFMLAEQMFNKVAAVAEDPFAMSASELDRLGDCFVRYPQMLSQIGCG
jgi:hypothetical protein